MCPISYGMGDMDLGDMDHLKSFFVEKLYGLEPLNFLYVFTRRVYIFTR